MVGFVRVGFAQRIETFRLPASLYIFSLSGRQCFVFAVVTFASPISGVAIAWKNKRAVLIKFESIVIGSTSRRLGSGGLDGLFGFSAVIH